MRSLKFIFYQVLPTINFGNDIEFRVPDKPFFNPHMEQASPQETFPEQNIVDTTPLNDIVSDNTSTAVYDRNWLLQ